MGGRVSLRQSQNGYRAGLDAALLAAAVELSPGERGIEPGCGPGAALLQVAKRVSDANLVGVERDPEALALAQANIVENHLTDRVQALAGDVAQPFSRLGLAPFDASFANPPYFDDAAAIRGPNPERKGAWIADDGLAAWIGFLSKSVREGGRITLIHRADRLADILALLAPKAGSFRIRPVHPFADAPAKRVLVRAVKTGKAPLVLLPPLILRQRTVDAHTPEMDAVFRGESRIDWT